MTNPEAPALVLDSGVELPDAFDSWAAGLVLDGELSQRSADKYRPLWLAWRSWLLLRQWDWRQVTGALIEEFLQGAAPGQGGRRRALSTDRMSSYTRQRYWRLLRGVYATAVRDGLLPCSPVLEVAQKLRPRITLRDRQSQVLEPLLFARLREPQVLRNIIAIKTEADWWHARDRAMLALLVDAGITTAELIGLQGRALKRLDRCPLDPQLAVWLTDQAPPLFLELMDSDDSVGRSLQLDARYTPLLMAWLRQRQVLLAERVGGRDEAGVVAVEQFHAQCQQAPLFMARRARASNSELPAMEAVTVYHTVSQALRKLRSSLGASATLAGVVASEPYVAKGPAVIRNSVLKHWLDTVGPEETVKRAGLKRLESLRLQGGGAQTDA
jgi:integrase